MKSLLKKMLPPEFFDNPAYGRALMLMSVYVLVLICQLFTYERFASTLGQIGLPGGAVMAKVLSFVLPVVELVALPYLISLRMSPKWRRVSSWAVIAAPTLWLVLAVAMNIWTGFAGSLLNCGLFGATLSVPIGIWMMVFCGLWLWGAVLVVRELPARVR